jgi:hypothetical protein
LPSRWLDAEADQWAGRARMANARLAAGVGLDSVDRWALLRADIANQTTR